MIDRRHANNIFFIQNLICSSTASPSRHCIINNNILVHLTRTDFLIYIPLCSINNYKNDPTRQIYDISRFGPFVFTFLIIFIIVLIQSKIIIVYLPL